MFEGYMSFAGNEVINVARLQSYISAGYGPPGVNITACDNCDVLPQMLGEEQPYRSPMLDEAPWYETGNPDSWDFAGVLPLEITGHNGSTRQATTSELSIDGGIASRVRYAGRTVSVSALLLGKTGCSVEAGLGWLSSTLAGTACSGPRAAVTAGQCTGDEMCMFTCCPDALDELPIAKADPVTESIPTIGDWRVTDGVWYSGSGRLTPNQVARVGVSVANQALNPGMETGNLGGWSTNNTNLYPGSFDQLAPIGGFVSLMTTRSATSPSTVVGSAYANGTASGGAAAGLKVTPGQSVTASMAVRTEGAGRSVRGRIGWYDAGGAFITYSTPVQIDNVTAGTPVRVEVTAVAPANAASMIYSIDVLMATGNAPTGERAWYDNLQIGGGPYVDGDMLGYFWQVGRSGSQTMKYGLPITGASNLMPSPWETAAVGAATERFTGYATYAGSTAESTAPVAFLGRPVARTRALGDVAWPAQPNLITQGVNGTFEGNITGWAATGPAGSVPTVSLASGVGVATNLSPNPGLEGGLLTGWQSNNGTLYPAVLDTTSAMTGVNSVRVDRTATSPATVAASLFFTPTASASVGFAISPGQVLVWSLDWKSDQANRRASYIVSWLDGAGTVLSSTPLQFAPNRIVAANTVSRISHTAGPAPANTVTARLSCTIQTDDGSNALTGERTWFDNLRVSVGTPTADAVNLHPNPNVGDSTQSGSLTYWITNNATLYPTSLDTTAPISGRFSCMSTRGALTGAADSAPASISLAGAGTGTMLPVTAGVSVTASLDIKPELAGRQARMYYTWWDAAGTTNIGSSNRSAYVSLGAAGTVTRLSMTESPPSGSFGARAVIEINVTDQSASTVGERVWFDNARVSTASTETTYFSGSTPPDGTYVYVWTGNIGSTTAQRYKIIGRQLADSTYFDGATAAGGGFTYAWTGTANASTSERRIPPRTGTGALRIDWTPATGSGGAAYATVTGLVVGRTYQLEAWIYVPGGSESAQPSVGVQGGPNPITARVPITTTNQWVLSTSQFTAQATSYVMYAALTSGVPAAGSVCFVDDVRCFLLQNSVISGDFESGMAGWTGGGVIPSSMAISNGPTVATNRATNPNMEPSAFNPASFTGVNSNDATLYQGAASMVSPISGSYSAMFTRTAATPTGTLLSAYITGSSSAGINALPVPAGTTLTIATDVRVEAANRQVAASYIRWLDSSSAVIGQTTTQVIPLTSGVVTRLVHTGTAPANTAYAYLYIVLGSTNATNIPTGERCWFDNVRVDFGTDSTIFDGSTPSAGGFNYGWTGLASASTSVKRVNTHSGTQAMAVTWPNGAASGASWAQYPLAGLTVGRQYTVEAWVYVPGGVGAPSVILNVQNLVDATAVTARDSWVLATATFVANATTATLRVVNSGAVTASGLLAFIDDVRVIETNRTTRLGFRTHTTGNNPRIPAGTTFVFSAYMWVSPDYPAYTSVSAIFRDDPNNDSSAATFDATTPSVQPVNGIMGRWVRYSWRATVNAGRTITGIYLSPNSVGTIPTNSFIDTTCWMISTPGTNGTEAYFDGDGVPNPTGYARNLIPNPIGPNVNAVTNWSPARMTLAVASDSTGPFVRGTITVADTLSMAQRINTTSSYGAITTAGNQRVNVGPGAVVRLSAQVRSSRSMNMAVMHQWMDANNVAIGTVISPQVATNPNDWTQIPEFSATAPAGTVYAIPQVGIADTAARQVGDTLDFRQVMFTSDGAAIPWFSGDTAWDGTYNYTWMTTPQISGSERMARNQAFTTSWRGVRGQSASDRGTTKIPTLEAQLVGPVLDCFEGAIFRWRSNTVSGPVRVSLGAVDPETGAVLERLPTFTLNGNNPMTPYYPHQEWAQWRPAIWVQDGSIDVTPTLTHTRYSTVADCANALLRSYLDVTCISGPTVVEKMDFLCGEYALRVEWTMYVGNPFIFGPEVPLATRINSKDARPDPTIDNTTDQPKGSLAFGVTSHAIGTIDAADTACPAERPVVPPAVVDPCCGGFKMPPGLPTVIDTCFDQASSYRRTVIVVPRDYAPANDEGTLVISLLNDGKAKRDVRIRVFPDPTGDGYIGLNECDWCEEFTITYIHANDRVTIDGVSKRVYTNPSGAKSSAVNTSAGVRGPNGGPFDFPSLLCNMGYMLAIDVPEEYEANTACAADPSHAGSPMGDVLVDVMLRTAMY